MADSFPQIARCAEAQWRGLAEADRTRLTLYWTGDVPFSATLLHEKEVAQINVPVWRVVFADRSGGLDLMSVKTDWIGDVP